MNTTLELSEFVSIPCAVRKVSDRQDIKLDRATLTGHKIRRIDVDATAIGEGVPLDEDAILSSDDIQHGRWEGDEFHPIPAEAIKTIKDETNLETAKIDGYVKLKDVPWKRATACYYIGPQKGGPVKPLALFQKALAKKKVAAVLKLTPRDRQVLAVVYADNGALMMNTLSYASDFRREADAAASLEGVQVDASAVKLGEALIEANLLTADAIDSYVDDALDRKAELVELALAGKPITKRAKKAAAVAPQPDALMEALRASIAQSDKTKSASRQKVPA